LVPETTGIYWRWSLSRLSWVLFGCIRGRLVPEKCLTTLFYREERQMQVPEKQPDIIRLWQESHIMRLSWDRQWIFPHGTAAV
jgi:hypothetical protein